MYGNNRFPGSNRHFGRFFVIAKGHTDNGRTQTDIFFYRDARTHLNKADRHKSRAHTKEPTHIKTLYWQTLLNICILAHLHTGSFAY